MGESVFNRERAIRNGFRSCLVLIEFCVIGLPLLIGLHLMARGQMMLTAQQLWLVGLILILVLAGLVLLRQIFGRFLAVTLALSHHVPAQAEGGQGAERGLSDLKRFSWNLDALLRRLENTTGELRRRVFELFTIRDMTEVASRVLDIDVLLQSLLEKAMAVSSARIGSVFIYDPKGRRLQVVAHAGLNPGPEKHAYIEINRSLLRHVVQKRRPMRVNDIALDPRTCRPNDPRYGNPSFLAMPVMAGNELVGVISLANKEDGVFDADDQRTLAVLIQEIGFAVANARLHAQVSAHLAQLQESEEKYRGILHSIAYGYFETDLEGRLVFCNEILLEILGVSRRQALEADLCGYLRGTDAIRVRHLATALKGGKTPAASADVHLGAHAGQERVAAVTLFLIRDGQGMAAGFRGVIRDITDRRRKEMQQRQMELRLHKRQRLEVLGTLAGGVAHNFNNLLMGIQGNADLMRMQLAGETALQRQVDNIQNLVSSGARMTRQMLGYARDRAYDPKPTALAPLVETALDTFRAAYPQIRFEKCIGPDPTLVMADRGQMEQVLLHLLVNAVEAMDEDGRVIVTVEALAAGDVGPLNLAPVAPRGLRLTVADTGQGMDPQTLGRVFEPFFTTKDVGCGGRGLGLATVYGIIADHQGHIGIDSSPGCGTMVTIHLPALAAAPTPTAKPAVGVQPGVGTVIIVDDEPTVLEIGTLMLEALGYTVCPASSGAAAITAMEAGGDQVCLAVVDMIMPELSGPELFGEIRRRRPGLPVLLTSGDQYGSEVENLLKYEHTGFLQKPFCIEELAGRAGELIGLQPASSGDDGQKA